MKKLMMLLAAGGLALGLVALTPEPAEAGKGWRGGHYGKAWRGGRYWRGPRYAYRGWRGPRYGYRGWRGYGWGWGGVGVWAPGVAVVVGPRWGGCWRPGWGYVPCRRWGWGWGY